MNYIVVCITVGFDSHIILGQEVIEPKQDSSNEDEGESAGGRRLIIKIYKQDHHFVDIIAADTLY